MNQQFEQMRHGYHDFDLLQTLDRAKCEVWFDSGRTRADVAGLDKAGNALWVIEIERSSFSQAAIDHALGSGIPLFVVDLTHLSKPTVDDPMAETKCWEYIVLWDNLVRGFYPSVTKSFNTECERKVFGMGPDDHTWSKLWTYVHSGAGNCDNPGCLGCEVVVLHECGEYVCPDTLYMFEHGIDRFHMYSDPVHRANSHAPQPRL